MSIVDLSRSFAAEPSRRAAPMTRAELQEHIIATYFCLRVGLCVLAFLFPVLLLGLGWWKGIPLQGSMSAYYFAFFPTTSELRVFPERTVFVGILFAIGFFLILYRGFSKAENWALNIAGLSALLVALFPMKAPDYCENCGIVAYPHVHSVAAIVLFVCIAFVSFACSEETLALVSDRERKWYRRIYAFLAFAMIVLPVSAVVMTYFFEIYDKKTLFVEWTGIATFSCYWAIKSYELHSSKAEKKVTEGEMPLVGEGSAGNRIIRAARRLT
jgi:uncharacterized membrane protein